jgi:N-acetylneuraminic acid mutarotase
VYSKNTAITDNVPRVSGGAVANYSITPALPAGLSLNATTGVISGTPTALAPQTSYTVTATNAGGHTTCSLVLTVTEAAPSHLAYGTGTAVYTKGTPIVSNSPSSSGGAVTTYAVSPALPAGLNLDPATGVISGTPTMVVAKAIYTVTASNSGGGTTCALEITVQDVAPSALVYTANPVTYYLNTAVTAPNTPTHAGGTVITYWVAPALPPGLLLNAATGVISGTPLATSAQATYRVTASNSGGSTTCDLVLTVLAPAPANLAYATNPMVCNKGLATTPNQPSSSGGPVASYSIAPALPAGLGLDAATGIISGTPTAITPMAVYVVTATNTGGSTTANLTLTVKDQAPANLAYATNPSSYTINQPIQPNVPSNTGGAITSYTVSPALPTGLTLSATTGVISGTPTLNTPQATYVITGSNATASTTCNFVTSVVGTPIPPPATPVVTTVTYATAGKVGYLASTQDQGTANGMGYAWTLNNGTLTSGQGTTTITFTAGAVGPLTVSVKATSLGGSATGTANATVVAAPTAPLFAQGQTHHSNNGVLASVPPQSGMSYLWTLGGAGVLSDGTTPVASYTTALSPGSYQLSVDVQNLAGDHASSSRTLDMVGNAFLADVNGPPQLKLATATVLQDGRVLVAGGQDGGLNYLANTYLYDPYSATWAPVAAMSEARADHTATLLRDGRVLVTGGLGHDANFNSISLSSAEIFDPAARTWTNASPMSFERDSHTATLLADGRVLVAGGIPTLTDLNYDYLDTAEIYDPTTDGWSDGGLLSKRRANHSATLLPSGKVLLAGGETAQNDSAKQQTTDIFDPTTRTWTAGPNMPGSRIAHSADLLANGKVLVSGGFGSAASTSAILFNPAANGGAGGWSATANAMTEGRYNHRSVLLPSGKVLVVAGGSTVTSGKVVASAELYDPVTNLWSSAGSLAFGRVFHHTVLLPDGKVFTFGGDGGNNTLLQVSAEAYDPAQNYWTHAGGVATPRHSHTTTILQDGTLLVAGGNYAGTVTESFDPTSGRWSRVGSMITGRYMHGAVLLADGKLLVAGGWQGTAGFLASAETYLPDSKTWTAAASMTTPRRKCTATRLANGKVLVVGGESSTYAALASAELYDPSTNTWTSGGSLAAGRFDHTATLLSNGKVLVAGGRGSSHLNSAELYDPASNTWSTVTPMNSVRQFHTATLLPNDQILVAGGTNGAVFTATAEIYDAAANTWTAVNAMGAARGYHASTLLPDNTVLVTAGYGGTYGPKLQTAERFNPATGTWTPVGNLLAPRRNHSATVLGGTGAVLVVGGEPNSACEIWKP